MIGVFGANGFIGSYLTRQLARNRYDVRGVSRRISPDLKADCPGVEFVEADLHDEFAMMSALQGLRAVVQLISTSSPGLGNSYELSDIRDNVIPHVSFMRAAITAGVERFIFLSSGGTVYGPGSVIPITEDAPTNPISSHGLTKLIIEKYLQMHGYIDGLDFVILRLANPFGPGQVFRKNQGLIPSAMSQITRGEPIRIIGQGDTRRDYIFIEDVVDAIVAAIDSNDARRSIINIGSGESRSVIEVIEAMEKVLGRSLQREHVVARKTDVDVNQLNIGRARELLGWVPKTDFTDALRKTLATYI